MRIVLALTLSIASFITSPVYSGECYKRDILASFLEEKHQLKLHSWGLNDDMNMEELFLSDTGHWSVIETTPYKCSSIVSMPHKLYGRLWEPPTYNLVIPPDVFMSPGQPI